MYMIIILQYTRTNARHSTTRHVKLPLSRDSHFILMFPDVGMDGVDGTVALSQPESASIKTELLGVVHTTYTFNSEFIY